MIFINYCNLCILKKILLKTTNDAVLVFDNNQTYIVFDYCL